MTKEKHERLSFETFSYEESLEKIRQIINEHDTRIDAIEQIIPKAPEPPKITTKEECEKAGGTWDDEKNTCKLPEKKEETLEGLGVLPTSTTSPNVDARANFFREKILGKSKEETT